MIIGSKSYTKETIRHYVGDLSQIAGARVSRLTDGKADGVKTIEVNTGSGLVFTILPDRCMDIAWATFNGQSLTHITKSGIVSSKYYDSNGNAWFRSYFAGLLTTCGLRNTGAACVDKGEAFGLHGRIGNTPAEKVAINEYWEKDDYYIEITGYIREAVFYGEHLELKRTIKVKVGEPKIMVHDEVTNLGYKEEPLFLLYHTNYGFPLISDKTTLELDTIEVDCYDEAATAGINDYKRFQVPTKGYIRQVFLHKLRKTKDGQSRVAILNDDLVGFRGVTLTYSADTLPEFFEFKMMDFTDYQLGLEPSNCLPMGRQQEREQNRIKLIKPNETIHYALEYAIVLE
ncbi:aldose 1-epimerase family protein [Vallitalea pronyensis]|uniref:Aldose 1-epimerase family protein n=1 Tax=Vallitalea pronyensis TaxID=1348613 RepID=A0A8J8MPJ5_9FIRM|nr:aldose 1-epimerase family protein [Vallitalea pronyensis]QUI25366.1 aldose 1-epimerase family protein [Vallitalea pronyensis]